MKIVNALAVTVCSTGLLLANSAFALGSAIVVAPAGPAAEADGAGSAAQAGMTLNDNGHRQATRAKSSHSTHPGAANAASGPAASIQ